MQSVTDTLMAFLHARLKEDERVARDCSGEKWWEHPKNWVSTPPLSRVGLVLHDGDRSHILRHDPARVLAEVDAKRQIVDFAAVVIANEHGIYERTSGDHQYNTLRLLALPYADHPDYRAEWRP